MDGESIGGNVLVRNARVHPTGSGPAGLSDVVVEGGTITSVSPAGKGRATGDARVLDADGRLVCPPFVEPHIHLDSVLTVGEPSYNRSGTLIEGILTWSERKKSLSHDEVKRRAREAIRWEVALGTGVIRSHVDVCDPSLTAMQALLERRDDRGSLPGRADTVARLAGLHRGPPARHRSPTAGPGRPARRRHAQCSS